MTENVINLYETRRMLGVIRQISPVPSFLRRFQKSVNQSTTDIISVDIVKGGRKVAPYVTPAQEGVVIERGGYTTSQEKIPYIRIKRVSEADKYLTTSAGNSPFSDVTPAQLAAKELVDDFTDLNETLDMEEERQRAEALFQGKVTIRNEKGVTLKVVNFGLTQTGSPSTPWTAATGFNDVLEFLRTKVEKITKTGAPAPTDIVMAGDVGNVAIRIFSPDNKTSYLSPIMVERGQLNLETVEPGVMYLGYFLELGCNVWVYNGEYTDLDGATKPLVPAGKLGIFSRKARLEMNYCAIKNFHGNFAPIPRFPHTWLKDDGSARMVQVESGFLFVPFQIDSVGVFDVL